MIGNPRNDSSYDKRNYFWYRIINQLNANINEINELFNDFLYSHCYYSLKSIEKYCFCFSFLNIFSPKKLFKQFIIQQIRLEPSVLIFWVHRSVRGQNACESNCLTVVVKPDMKNRQKKERKSSVKSDINTVDMYLHDLKKKNRFQFQIQIEICIKCIKHKK